MKTILKGIIASATALSVHSTATAVIIYPEHCPIVTYTDENTPSLFIETDDGVYMPGPVNEFTIDYTMADDGSYIMALHSIGRNSPLLHTVPVDDITTMQLYYPYTATITIECGNENWDNIYATPRGYFATRRIEHSNGEPEYDEIRYLSFNGYAASMMFNPETGIPLSLTTPDINLIFNASPHIVYDIDGNGDPIESECEFACDSPRNQPVQHSSGHNHAGCGGSPGPPSPFLYRTPDPQRRQSSRTETLCCCQIPVRQFYLRFRLPYAIHAALCVL